MKKEKILKILCIILVILLIIFIILPIIYKKKDNNTNSVFDVNAAIRIVKDKYDVKKDSIIYIDEDDNYIIYGKDKDNNTKMYIVNKETKLVTVKSFDTKAG